MPSSRHHNEWLSRIEVSGPFLSVPVLERVFPHGLDAHDAEQARLLKLAFEEWEDNQQGERPNPAIHREWINYVLKQTLGLPDEVLIEGQAIPQTLRATFAEQGETLRPDLVVRNPEGGPNAGKARLLVQTYPPTQAPEKPIPGRHWKASPASRMMELLHATDTRLGLVTNGEQWMLVDAPKGETTGFASWYANLRFEEPLTLRAFRSLLAVHRFFSVADDETVESMLKESASNQQEVTDRLGYQVRQAVEVIIRSLDRIDQDEKGRLLSGVSESELYEAALTVMMRLVFLFSAEERGLLLLGDPLYDEHYAVSTLVAKLQEAADQHGEEVLERRHDAWVRLLSTFRAVYGGVQHERMKLLPYAGKLFDPDRFLFLEGRKKRLDDKGNMVNDWTREAARPLPIDNRTVLHLLRSLQYLELHGEARRLSFRALDIEQIGHVYEGLLDHTAKWASEPMLSLTAAKGDEPEVTLFELERLKAKGDAELVKFLKEQTGRSESALKKALDAPVAGDAAKKLRAVCGDDRLFSRVQPFSGLIRNDTFDRPVVIRGGSVLVTAGTDRRSSGTHYTPRSLTEPIVQHTLEPLVYVGPAEGRPKEEWKLHSAKELLELKICDMACGSGAFLVQADRYLSERLVEAWEDAGKQHPEVPGITPEGTASIGTPGEQLIPKDPNERLALARRIVAQRCLYGVDKNPLAVEMAKLSLWLLTLAKDKPFTFLDHAIRCGDSLVGIRDLEQLRKFNLDPKGEENRLFLQFLDQRIREVVDLRTRIVTRQSDRVEDVQFQQSLLKEASEKIERIGCSADMLVGAEFLRQDQDDLIRDELRGREDGGDADGDGDFAPGWLKAKRSIEQFRRAARTAATIRVASLFNHSELGEFREETRTWLNAQTPFHWPLEFAEVVVERGWFDAFVCNPPFMGGTKLEPAFGRLYRELLVEHLANAERGIRGTADLCAYFFLRAASLVRAGGCVGMLATNTISEGDTRQIGLTQLLSAGLSVFRAVRSRKWPGVANLEVASVWLHNGPWAGEFNLNGQCAAGITSFLQEPGTVAGQPFRLKANENKCIEGAKSLGMGFVLDPAEAAELIARDARNSDVVLPFLTGEDINSTPDQSATRWAIYFGEMPVDKEHAPEGYTGPCAADYPACLSIVEERVRPQRLSYPPDSSWNRSIRDRWWQFGLPRPALLRAKEGLTRVLARSAVSNLNSIAFSPSNAVFSHVTKVFPFDDYGVFALLQSAFHDVWLSHYASSMRTDVRYTPETCFDTFAFPPSLSGISAIGETYHEHRARVMLARLEGLTKTYNRFHSMEVGRGEWRVTGEEFHGHYASDEAIVRLRHLHVEMDRAVALAYGWSDLSLAHDFHETKQGVRFTISESARRAVLARLLKLNHERYAEEVEQGLHDKKGKAKRAASGPVRRSSATFVSMPLKYDDDGDSGTADKVTQNTAPGRDRTSRKSPRADRRIQPSPPSSDRPTPIDQIETDEIMAAFRQAARGRGWVDRDELLKEVSVVLGYQRLGPKIDEALRGHLRAAIRRRIIEAEGPTLVRAGTGTMADYDLEELRETFRSVMREGTTYEREDVIHSLARYLGFARVTETSRDAIKSAINSGIRHGVLGYEGSVIWREE
jgi:hypothetical protein